MTRLVTATGAQNIAGKVVSDATLTTPDGSSDAIKDATDTSKLVTAEQVKTYVTNNAQVTVKVGETEQATTNLELAGSAGDDVTITATADTADGYKVTFDATIDKAIVTDGVIDTTTGNGDKVISATAAKAVAEKAIETALADTADGSLGKKINDVQEIAEAKVADVTVDDSSIVDDNKVAKLTTTGINAIAADGESTSTKLATEASVAKTAQNLTTAIDAIAGVGVSYQVLGDNEKHESVTAPVKGRIYLEKDETAADGTYIEWFYTGTDWEKIGSTKADHSGYAKTITINKETKTVSDNAVDLGKAATSVTAGGGITSGTVSDTGALSLILDEASTDKKGIVQLASEHDSEDTDNAATGATVASAISGIASTSQNNKGVTVTTAGGSVTDVEVTTTPLVVEDALVESVTDDNLITAADALAAIKLAKPENYVESVTVGSITTSGETALTINDGRTTVYPNDLWGTTVSMVGNTITVQSDPIDGSAWGPKNGYNTKGQVIFDNVRYPQGSNPITKVENNMVYNGTTKVANIKINELVNGKRMFSYTLLKSFSGDLSSLVNSSSMFNYTPLESFSGDLSSLIDGTFMFYHTPLESFGGDLSSLIKGDAMFSYTLLESFSGDLSSLTDGSSMFSYNDSLTSFSGDLSSLVNGNAMFGYTSLESFSGDLSSLVNGSSMFYDTSLDVESVELICDVLPNYNTENGGKKLQTATWNESGENAGKYTYSDWTSGNAYYYPIIKITTNNGSMSQGNIDGIDRIFGTDYINESDVKTISIIWKSGSAILGEGHEADRTKIAELFTNTATEKGWTFIVNTEIAESGEIAPPNAIMATDGTIQYYIFAKKDEATEDNATHIDASGKLWKFDTAEAIIGPNIKYWSMFATVEDALTEWGLTPWTKPQETEEA